MDSADAGRPGRARAWPAPMGQAVDANSRQLAMFAHLSAILTGFIGPLIFYLVKKDEDPFVADQSREALNFNLSVLIYSLGLGIVSFLLAFILIGFLLFFLYFPLLIGALIFMIIAGVEANKGVLLPLPADHPAGELAAPYRRARNSPGAIAQLEERLLCKQEVAGSSPAGSTSRVRKRDALPTRAMAPGAFGASGSRRRRWRPRSRLRRARRASRRLCATPLDCCDRRDRSHDPRGRPAFSPSPSSFPPGM